MRTSVAVILLAIICSDTQPSRAAVGDRAMTLTRETAWKLVASLPIRFRTFHPQGMVKIGDVIYLSSVEVKVAPRRFPAPANGFDRDTGEGVGHIFKIDASGNLLADIRVGEGTIYHPGGMDYDGSGIWVPVAEYRPNSRSIIYRVDPGTLAAHEVFRVDDHIGALAYDTDDDTLHGASWGSRRFHTWKIESGGARRRAAPRSVIDNPSHYVDYQDCKYAGRHRAVCSGVTEFRPQNAVPFRLGGIDTIDLQDGRPLHQTPILLWTAGGIDMTHNPVWLESTSTGLRAYFMPDDDASTLYVYETGS